MKLYDFDYHLPQDRIALRPARPRSSARLLVAEGDSLRDLVVRDLPSVLRPGDRLVLNDTRVIPARLSGTRTRAIINLCAFAFLRIDLLLLWLQQNHHQRSWAVCQIPALS